MQIQGRVDLECGCIVGHVMCPACARRLVDHQIVVMRPCSADCPNAQMMRLMVEAGGGAYAAGILTGSDLQLVSSPVRGDPGLN